MQHRHTQGMIAACKHLRWVVNSIEELYVEVKEDIKICGSLEALMMHPPNLSQLYLPFCDGREVLQDAATPRSDEADHSTEETVSPRSVPGTPGSPAKSMLSRQMS